MISALLVALFAGAGAYSTSTTMCYEHFQVGCPDDWPTEECTVDSGTTLCRCPQDSIYGNQCLIGDGTDASGVTGRCAENVIKVDSPGGSVHEEHAGGVTAFTSEKPTTQTLYCTNMIRNDEWDRWTRQPTDGPAWLGNSWGWWWSCWSWQGRTWRNGACLDSTRYLGETCWDGFWGTGSPGQCSSPSEWYSEYSVPCKDSRCQMFPKVSTMMKTQCSCSVSGGGFAWLAFACTSSTCDGHACVLTTQDMNYYCDYATPQTVTGWFR